MKKGACIMKKGHILEEKKVPYSECKLFSEKGHFISEKQTLLNVKGELGSEKALCGEKKGNLQ